MRFGDFGAVFEIMDDVTRAARVDVLTAEDDFRETVAFCLRQFVPEFAAMHIKDNLVAQEGAADTQRYNEIHVVLYMVGQFLQVLQGRRAVEMAFFNVGQLGEQHLFRLAVLGQMRTDKTFLTHNLHGFVSFLQIFFIAFQVSFRNLTFAVQVFVIKLKTGCKLQTHSLHSSSSFQIAIVTYILIITQLFKFCHRQNYLFAFRRYDITQLFGFFHRQLCDDRKKEM